MPPIQTNTVCLCASRRSHIQSTDTAAAAAVLCRDVDAPIIDGPLPPPPRAGTHALISHTPLLMLLLLLLLPLVLIGMWM